MTNAYMKDSLKRITAVILLAAATLLVALQCGSIAKKEEAAALLVPTLPLRAIKCLQTDFFAKAWSRRRLPLTIKSTLPKMPV